MTKLGVGVVVAICGAVILGFARLWFVKVPEAASRTPAALTETGLDLSIRGDLVAVDRQSGEEAGPSVSEAVAVAGTEASEPAKDDERSNTEPTWDAAYKKAFEKEPVNPAWSPQTAAMIESLISTSGALYNSLTVECRATMCRVEVTHTVGRYGIDAAENAQKVSDSVRPIVEQSRGRLDTIGSGTHTEKRPDIYEGQQLVTRIWITGRDYRQRR